MEEPQKSNGHQVAVNVSDVDAKDVTRSGTESLPFGLCDKNGWPVDGDGIDDAIKNKKARLSQRPRMSLFQATPTAPAMAFHISAMPENFQKMAKAWDIYDSGTLTQDELLRALEEFDRQGSLIKAQTKQIQLMICSSVILLLCLFASSYVSVIVAKDFAPAEGDATLRTSEGAVIRTGSSDYNVVGGKMVLHLEPETAEARVLKEHGTSRRVLTGSGVEQMQVDGVVGTSIARQESALSSVIPDKYLSTLNKVSVKAGEHSVSLGVTNFMRLSTVSSKCGSLVYLDTVAGRVTLDDTDLYLSAEVETYLKSMSIDPQLEGLSIHGRRLSASDVDHTGVFDFLETYDWQCTSEAKPGAAIQGLTSYKYTGRMEFSCESAATDVEADSDSTRPRCHSEIVSTDVELALTLKEVATSLDLVNEQIATGLKPGTVATADYAGSDTTHVITVPNRVVHDAAAKKTMTVSSYPNHPLQKLVEIKDHTAKKVYSFQVVSPEENKAIHISERSLTTDEEDAQTSLEAALTQQSNDVSQSSAHVAFVGRGTARDGADVRKFRISSPDATWAMQYWDRDTTGNAPYRVFVEPMHASQTFATFESAITAADSTEIADMMALYNSGVKGNMVIPSVVSSDPFSETEANVEFYTDVLLGWYGRDDVTTIETDYGEYWAAAVGAGQAASLPGKQEEVLTIAESESLSDAADHVIKLPRGSGSGETVDTSLFGDNVRSNVIFGNSLKLVVGQAGVHVESFNAAGEYGTVVLPQFKKNEVTMHVEASGATTVYLSSNKADNYTQATSTKFNATADFLRHDLSLDAKATIAISAASELQAALGGECTIEFEKMDLEAIIKSVVRDRSLIASQSAYNMMSQSLELVGVADVKTGACPGASKSGVAFTGKITLSAVAPQRYDTSSRSSGVEFKLDADVYVSWIKGDCASIDNDIVKRTCMMAGPASKTHQLLPKSLFSFHIPVVNLVSDAEASLAVSDDELDVPVTTQRRNLQDASPQTFDTRHKIYLAEDILFAKFNDAIYNCNTASTCRVLLQEAVDNVGSSIVDDGNMISYWGYETNGQRVLKVFTKVKYFGRVPRNAEVVVKDISYDTMGGTSGVPDWLTFEIRNSAAPADTQQTLAIVVFSGTQFPDMFPQPGDASKPLLSTVNLYAAFFNFIHWWREMGNVAVDWSTNMGFYGLNPPTTDGVIIKDVRCPWYCPYYSWHYTCQPEKCGQDFEFAGGFYKSLCEGDMVTDGQTGKNLAEALSDLNAGKIFSTGHSLGGAKANILTIMFYIKYHKGHKFTCLKDVSIGVDETNLNIETVAFSAPPYLKNVYSQLLSKNSYVNRFNSRIVAHRDDGIARMSMITTRASALKWFYNFFFGPEAQSLTLRGINVSCLDGGNHPGTTKVELHYRVLSFVADLIDPAWGCIGNDASAFIGAFLSSPKGELDKGMFVHGTSSYVKKLQDIWDGQA